MITIKSINQAWLKIFYFKVIAVNMVIHYKFIRDNAEKFSEFFHHQKLPKEVRGWFCLLLVMKKF